MEISATSFFHVLRNISEAVSLRESAMDYDNFLRMIFKESDPYDDEALADSETPFGLWVEDFPSEKFLGRDHEKDMLLSKLMGPYEKHIQLSVIPILGDCGIGKTTLARLVYEDERVKERFELQVWVKVEGQELKTKEAAHGILKSTMGGMSCSLDDLDELDEMVRDTLQSQRCLIVFDGVESMANTSWLHMNQYWFDFVDLGSKVLITTPSKDVADLVSNQSFELTQVSQDVGLSMLECLAFDSSEGVKDISKLTIDSDIEGLRNLSALCRGNPLSLKLVGSLIRYDKLLIFGTLVPHLDASVATLLSIWALSPHLRRCFAYSCAIFPKGYALNKEKIIAMWTAAGLVKPSLNNSLEDTANSHFFQLLCRSFFTDITRNQYGDIIEFRIPRLIHKIAEDVARIVYKEKLGVIGSIAEDAARLSLVSLLAGEYKSQHMGTLVLSPTLYLGGSMDHSLLDFKELQSLDLSCSGIRNLSDDICVLRELRYLNLSYTLIERLPDSTTGLSQLRTLDLSWCYHLKVLPKRMRKLKHMKHLDLSRCESLSYLPSRIGFLISLTSMPLFVVGKDHYCARLGELGLLNQLRGRLEIRNLENVRQIREARDAKLDQKNLHHLGLSWSQNADECFELLKLLQPNQQLKVLSLTGYMGYRFPWWLSSINSLIKISVTDCGCKELPSLGQLPFLKELQLEEMTNLERIDREFYGDGVADMFFPSLEKLELYDLPRLIEWSEATLPRVSRLSDLARLFRSGTTTYPDASRSFVFGSLKTLTVEGCPKLSSLPSLPTLPDLIVSKSNKSIVSSLASFTSLCSLLINDMELGMSFMYLSTFGSLKKLILCNIKDEIISFYERLTAPEHLGILHCHHLTHLSLNFSPLLQKLHIVDCPNLRGVFVREEEDTPLMELVVEDCPKAFPIICLPSFRSLRKLILKNCCGDFSIYYAREFKKLEKLEYLIVSGCPKLESELQAFPRLISHIPCIIVGNQKANFKDSEDLREVPISASYEPKSEMMVPYAPQKSITGQSIRNVIAMKYKEITKATKNFGPDMLLGKGGFGTVFKGWIDEHSLTAVKPGSGIAVAVKKWRPESNQGHEELLNEIHYLSQLHHPNLVKLIGYCMEKDNRNLVYEFMPNGSLNNHLFPKYGGHQSLSWATRIKVAVGAARALSFLHGLEIPIIHRDVKSADILLDGEFNAKLSDFGIARDGLTGDTAHVSTPIMGTIGYIAPEFLMTGWLTTKCDVYGFGVVLVELLSGCRVFDLSWPKEDQNLVEWAKPYLGDKEKLLQVMDTRLEGQYSNDEAYTVAKLAMQCLSLDPIERPRMAEVVVALEQLHRSKTF